MGITLIEPNLGGGSLKPPLGIGYIAASLKQRGISFELVDLSIDKPSLPHIEHDFRNRTFELVGISCYSWDYTYGAEIARMIKRLQPDSIIIMGGETPSGDPDLVFKDCQAVDIIVRGEGEHTIVELIEALETQQDLSEIEGISFRSGNEIVHTKGRQPVMNIDSLPSPFLSNIFDLKHYKSAYIMTARGCPFECIFCSWGSRKVHGKHRTHSIQRVIDELRYLHDHGIRTVNPGDGTFNHPPERMLELCRAIKSEKFDFRWYDVDMRADLVSREQLKLLKAINTTEVGFGLETIKASTQKIIGKNLNPEHLPKAIKMAKEEGLEVHISIMIGLPGETKEDVLKTIEFAKNAKATRYGIFPVRVHPGTILYENPENYNITPQSKACNLSFAGENEFLSCSEIRKLEAYASSQMTNLNIIPPHVYEKQFFNDFLA